MRFIGTISNEDGARKIVLFLKQKEIESRCESSFESDTGHMNYHLWIVDEDKISEAMDYFARFQKNPFDPEFNVSVETLINEEKELLEASQEEPIVSETRSPLTFIFLGLCIFLFMWSSVEEVALMQRGFASRPFSMTAIQAKLMYDLPSPFETFQKTIDHIPVEQTFESLPSETQMAFENPPQVPFFEGIYKWCIQKIHHQETQSVEGPLFTKILQGEVWRLFSPCFLHGGFFHILFNMLWLWILGRPLETRLGFTRTLGLTLAAGVGSNTAQYLISGPLFLGYSGIIMALASFIWVRQKVAPWEGYPLNRSTIYFLFLFIGAIFVLSLVSFFLQAFANIALAPNIANTAHIAGGIIGASLGYCKSFAARVAK